MESSKTKKSLIFSGLAILLCFVMLLGSTFAWFTDEAVANVNTIQAGTLKIEMLDAEGNSLEGQTLAWQKAAEHENEAILWEPGVTYKLQPVKIKNNGDLALSYKVEVTSMSGDTELNDVLEWSIEEEEAVSQSLLEQSAQYVLLAGEEKVVNISAHMSEDAGNEYMGLKIENVAITVFATQTPYEYDSTTNEYDDIVMASTVDNMHNALENSDGETPIVMANDIEVKTEELVSTASDNPAMFIITKDTVIDLNGKTLEYKGGSDCYYGFYVTNGAHLTIIDSSGDNNGVVCANDPAGTWVVNVADGSADIYGGTFKQLDGCCIYKNKGTINIYGGKFSTEKNSNMLLNLGNKYSSYGPIKVYGGSFKNFEPGVSNAGEVVVESGYKVVKDGDWYHVVAE